MMEGIYYFPAHGSGYRSDPDHLIWLLVFEGPVVVAEGRTYTRYQAVAFSADNGSFSDYLKTTQPASHRSDKRLILWIPACAGMTIRGRWPVLIQSLKGIYPVRSFEIDIRRLENLTAYIR